MRILADENLPPHTVLALRDAGHDVDWIRESARGADDAAVLAAAASTGRILITGDKDFGELVFRLRWPADSGVILIRARVAGSRALTALLMDTLAQREDWAGGFAVIEHGRVRALPLPNREG